VEIPIKGANCFFTPGCLFGAQRKWVPHSKRRVVRRLEVAVGITVTCYPPHRSVGALASAYGSYLG
jgi:hypothetical protein